VSGAKAWFRGDAPCRLDAVEDRHADVHQHNVWLDALGELHRLASVGRLPGDLYAVLRGEQRTETGPDQDLVVGEHHADHGDHATAVGSGCASSWG